MQAFWEKLYGSCIKPTNDFEYFVSISFELGKDKTRIYLTLEYLYLQAETVLKSDNNNSV